MTTQIHWILDLDIKPGKTESFKAVMGDLIANTEKEEGTRIYEWFFNEDSTKCSISERFDDSAAALTHLQGFGIFADRFLDAATPTRLLVLTEPDDAVKEVLNDLGPIYLKFGAGFSK